MTKLNKGAKQEKMLDALPLTPNEKVDRLALPVPHQARPKDLERTYPSGYVAPRDTVELDLTKIWEEVLGIQPIGVSDNFFDDLGGDSLNALFLFTQIEKTFGKKLPLATLIRVGTIEGLANILRQEEGLATYESLVPIQTGGDKPPLFCVHGTDGNVFVFQNLARYLDSDQPVYGLQPKGLDGKQAPHTRVEDMAAEYIRQIRTVQPKGPYLLAGFSAGGILAFEMAQQLQAQGQKVALLTMFDTKSPVYYKPLSWRDWVSRHLGNFLRLKPKQKLTYFVAGIKERLQKIVHKKFYLGSELSSTETSIFIGNKQVATDIDVFTAQKQALIDYVPQIYSGRIIFFRSYEQPWWLANDLESGWSGLATGGVEIHQVPGDHLSIVRADVRALAEQLKACLDSAQAQE